jgi:hypothetical protein
MDLNALAKKFSLRKDIRFPTEDECRRSLREIGISCDVPSYFWAKQTFGHSRHYEPNFYIGCLGLCSEDTLKGINDWWQDSVQAFLGMHDEELGNWRNIRPFCIDGEYRSIYGWDLTRPAGDGEFQIIHLDWEYHNAGYYPNIYEIYAAIADGVINDEMKRDANGLAILESL